MDTGSETGLFISALSWLSLMDVYAVYSHPPEGLGY